MYIQNLGSVSPRVAMHWKKNNGQQNIFIFVEISRAEKPHA